MRPQTSIPGRTDAALTRASVSAGLTPNLLSSPATFTSIRIFFRTLKKLSVDMERKNIDNVHMVCLSMGMTGDYETACEEGATFVRVGTGIFGERSLQI